MTMTRFIRLAALAALVFPFAASAQSAERGDRAEQRLTRLTERLGLTDAQVAIVREEMGEARDGERRRGHSWALAARLAPTMSDAQLEALRTQQATRAEQRRGRRSQGERSAEGRRQRAERPDPRADALNLTDAQKQALADRREATRADRAGQRAERREALADLLTEEQQAVLLVHRALDSPRGHRGRRGGPRGEHRGRR